MKSCSIVTSYADSKKDSDVTVSRNNRELKPPGELIVVTTMVQTCTHESYTVGIICALAVEKAAVEAMLDEEHSRLAAMAGDDNSYSPGRTGEHHVVVACPPVMLQALARILPVGMETVGCIVGETVLALSCS